MPAIGIELRDQLLVAEQAFDLLADRASSELIASYNEVTPHIPAGSQVDEVVTSNAYNIGMYSPAELM